MLGDRRRSLLVSLTAANVGLIIVGSWISIPFFPVPITLQTLFVLLSGAVMRRYGAIPPLLYVLMGAMNLPVFHNGMAGIGILLGPTGGYSWLHPRSTCDRAGIRAPVSYMAWCGSGCRRYGDPLLRNGLALYNCRPFPAGGIPAWVPAVCCRRSSQGLCSILHCPAS